MMLSYDLLAVIVIGLGATAHSHSWANNHDSQQARNWNPSLTLQQQRQQPPPVFLTSTRQPVDASPFKPIDSQQRQLQQKKDDVDSKGVPGNEVIGSGRSFDGLKGGNDQSLTPSSMSPDYHQQPPFNSRPYFNPYYNVHRFDPNFSSYPSSFPKFGPGYRKDKYGHGYGYSCKQGDDCDKVKEAVNQIPTLSPHSVSSHRPYQPFMMDGQYQDAVGHHMPYPPYKGQQFPDGRFYDVGSPYPTRYLHDQPQQPHQTTQHHHKQQQELHQQQQHHQQQQQHHQQQQQQQQHQQQQQQQQHHQQQQRHD